jgi:uncharacterized protein (UPF0332 family)
MTQQWDKESKEALMAYRINRADETVREAELMYQEEYYNGAVNRLYYACYYITIALLLKNDIQAQTHSGVKAMFGLHFISNGKVPYEIGKVLTTLFEKRQTGDYDDFVICSQQDVEELMQQTKEFVRYIKTLL